jgi:16S rRNA (guanine1207-N2)-methyltransferase
MDSNLILDVGCGYGPIGLFLAKTYPNVFVHMIDINDRAIALAKKNAQMNGIENISIYSSDLFANVVDHFSVVITNPPIRAGKAVVYQLFEESYRQLLPGGELWVVIQKKQGADSAKEKLHTLFSSVEVVEKKKGYVILCAKKN